MENIGTLYEPEGPNININKGSCEVHAWRRRKEEEEEEEEKEGPLIRHGPMRP